LCTRNYFDREDAPEQERVASAPETEDDDYVGGRAQAISDAVSLKKLAVDYTYHEILVKVQASMKLV